MPDNRTAIEHEIATPNGIIHVDEYPGEGPAVVMTHGFPDDSRIYDHLIPELPERRLVTFDFLGHGRSARDATWPMRHGQREGELAALIAALQLEKPVLVGHDIGEPVTIQYARLASPDRVGGMVLLNTFFGDSPTLEFPEFIRFLADPHLTALADIAMTDPNINGPMPFFTNSRLNPGQSAPPASDGVAAIAILPQFVGSAEQPDAIAAIRARTADLFPGILEQNAQIARGAFAQLTFPVTIAFGEHDPYLDSGVAEHLHQLFPTSEVHGISDAAHWPQWDQPAATAAVISESLTAT